jgi:hypothetical protein
MNTDTTFPAGDIANIIEALWERATGSLTPDDLEWFAGAADAAELDLSYLGKITEGIGILVNQDKCAGVFQDKDDFLKVMCVLSNGIRQAQALIHVASCATDRLRHPNLYTNQRRMAQKNNTAPSKNAECCKFC